MLIQYKLRCIEHKDRNNLELYLFNNNNNNEDETFKYIENIKHQINVNIIP